MGAIIQRARGQRVQEDGINLLIQFRLVFYYPVFLRNILNQIGKAFIVVPVLIIIEVIAALFFVLVDESFLAINGEVISVLIELLYAVKNSSRRVLKPSKFFERPLSC